MLRKLLGGFLHFLIFADFACAAALVLLNVQTALFRAGEQWDRRGSFFSLRRPLPSEFSKEYYASWRRSIWLGAAFVAVIAIGTLLLWLDRWIEQSTSI